jgi:hypothetical protein
MIGPRRVMVGDRGPVGRSTGITFRTLSRPGSFTEERHGGECSAKNIGSLVPSPSPRTPRPRLMSNKPPRTWPARAAAHTPAQWC